MITAFRNLKPGALFHALKPEKIGEREVSSMGLHVKIGNSHSVRVEQVKNGKITETKDAIFPLNMPCREVHNNRIDVSSLSEWALVNQGKSKKIED